MKKNISKVIQDNAHLSYEELAKKTGLNVDAVRKRYKRLGLPAKRLNQQNRPLTLGDEVVKDLTVRTYGAKLKQTDSKYKLLLEQNETLKAQLEAFKVLGDAHTHTIKSGSKQRGGATAVALCSDWHSEERVRSEDVNGLNEFTLDTFAKRADAFFVSVSRLVNVKQPAIEIKELVLALLGDFITGNIHEENLETCQLPPMEALMNVQEKLASGIRYLLTHTNVDLIIPCHSGNHARITKKCRNATEAGHSLEYVMYHSLANIFKDEPRVKFLIAPGYHSYLDIAGFVVRFHHGHALQFNGGVGGLTIPVRKSIHQWNTLKKADLDAFGHWHQQFFGGNFICNGSLIGFNAYAVRIKAGFEKPRQAFFLVNHSRKEVTDLCPVWLD